MSKKDFDVQCTAKVCCTHKKKEDPSGKQKGNHNDNIYISQRINRFY